MSVLAYYDIWMIKQWQWLYIYKLSWFNMSVLCCQCQYSEIGWLVFSLALQPYIRTHKTELRGYFHFNLQDSQEKILYCDSTCTVQNSYRQETSSYHTKSQLRCFYISLSYTVFLREKVKTTIILIASRLLLTILI